MRSGRRRPTAFGDDDAPSADTRPCDGVGSTRGDEVGEESMGLDFWAVVRFNVWACVWFFLFGPGLGLCNLFYVNNIKDGKKKRRGNTEHTLVDITPMPPFPSHVPSFIYQIGSYFYNTVCKRFSPNKITQE